jgi:hypothetical protein
MGGSFSARSSLGVQRVVTTPARAAVQPIDAFPECCHRDCQEALILLVFRRDSWLQAGLLSVFRSDFEGRPWDGRLEERNSAEQTGERVTRCVQAKPIARPALTQSQASDNQCLVRELLRRPMRTY